MSSASSAVTYTSVYTDYEPGRAFWGADDEEVFKGGIPRVIVYGYDELPLQPVVPHHRHWINIPGQAQMNHRYRQLFLREDEREAYDGPIDYPVDEGDDGDDDDGDSSGDDADDEDEDDEEEEEKYLAPADSTIVVPTDEPVSPPEGTEPVIPPPSTDITIGLGLTSPPLQASISLPSVERLSGMTTPSPHHLSHYHHPLQESALLEAVPEVAPMTVGEVNTRVTELAELHEHDTQDL
ncbi:hypothetical protein Tco_1335753 [Tanacetum coccineum]